MDVYDYVIVGAGSAGCVLANRLTEDPGITVLLLEAGGPDTAQEIHIPAANTKLFKSCYDWAYETEEQPYLNGRRIFWPRGKTLGGSSAINFMVYIRGNPRDYDHWRDLGNEGWGFDDVLPYFKRAEHQERGVSAYHGVGGPLYVANLRYRHPVSQALVDAGTEIGLPANDDFNGPTQEGIGFFQVTQKRGKRHSAADAYLKPALRRPNLVVQTRAHVTCVRFAQSRALGVAYLQGNRLREVRAQREVLLSGGALNSPQLLLLSGVGPADYLRSLSIAVVADLPGVGRNLQDHLLAPLAYACTQPISMAGVETIGNLIKYLLFARGPLVSNIGEAGGFLKTRPELRDPDLAIVCGAAYFLNQGINAPPGHFFTLAVSLMRPRSRGWLGLRSSDPHAPPQIQPNYLDDEEDLQTLIAGVRLLRGLAQATAFAPYRGAEVAPGLQAQSDAAITEHIRSTAETHWHPVGTCKMGGDPLAVVDARLRVHGVTGLRVVDASIMPTIITGNTNAATIMIAEHAADLIKADHSATPGARAVDEQVLVA